MINVSINIHINDNDNPQEIISIIQTTLTEINGQQTEVVVSNRADLITENPINIMRAL